MGLGFTPSFVTTCPRYYNFGFKNSHLFGYIFNPKFRNLSNTIARFRLCLWMVLSNVMMSSRYTKQLFPTNSCSAVSIMRWNVVGAFLSPKDMRL